MHQVGPENGQPGNIFCGLPRSSRIDFQFLRRETTKFPECPVKVVFN